MTIPQHPSSAEALNRRLRQKTATRVAIGSAALELARTKGLGNFTADEVAEHADVSRRTFFNYFPSIESAVNLPVEQFLDNALQRLNERPESEPILDAVLTAVSEDLDSEVLTVLIELCAMSRSSPELERYELQAWSSAQTQLEEGLRFRLPQGTSALFISCLAGSLMSCGQTALNEATFSEGSRTFHELLLESIEMLRSGFSLPN